MYGGAGVHVEYLAKELSNYVNLTVECQGAERSTAVAHQPWDRLQDTNSALQTISTELSMVADMNNADLVHSHTWYANTAGHLAALLYDIPHVMTVHSLEPLRPWKAEQLGGGYALSCWAERTAVESAAAVIAVSEAMKADVLSTYPTVDPDKVPQTVVMTHTGSGEGGTENHTTTTPLPVAGWVGYTVRVLPHHHLLASDSEFALISQAS